MLLLIDGHRIMLALETEGSLITMIVVILLN